jgi:diaminopimelate epimerase
MNGPFQNVPFSKVQSIGNDFVLLHLDSIDPDLLPYLARETADRRFAIGSDGLLAVGIEGKSLRLRMFNTDGTEDFCGNGIRCAAVYAFRKGWTDGRAPIRHLDHIVETSVGPGGMVTSKFDPPSFEPQDVPLDRPTELFMQPVEVLGETLVLSAVTTGSTHTVILTDRLPDDEQFHLLGPAIEHHRFFPERTSVIWAKPCENDSIRIRIWERGVGETLGCGTGSAAAAAVYARVCGRPSSYCLINGGGSVQVSVTDLRAPIITSADAEILYSGTWSSPMKNGQPSNSTGFEVFAQRN